ncbi:hypothetical protein IFM89_030095 [Coptis chinensis]|uniref:No apical meristem-associated C-terminal domain-containing protein n=1 Tax=Coptis chinensis TaxID=261450 RepID=A0A835IF69_9MAGN|nr:hypothetical protein IFM89_030095 [Coptis chinensis]
MDSLDEISPTPTNGKKRNRLSNFTISEDVKLCESWLTIGEDGIVGVGQTSGNYWQRITNEFKLRNPGTPRTLESIKARWQMINKGVSKFVGYMAQLENNRPSGTSIQDMMVRARVAYQDQEDTPFPFDHCYLMLKDTPKWHRSMETKTKPKTSKKIQGEGSSNVNDSQTPICLDEDVNAPTMTTSDLIRPDGVKKQKERKRRASEAAKVVEGFVSRVELRMEKQNKLLETQLQSKDRDQELKNKKIEAMERREEAKIMAMDLSDFRREYFKAKQVEIYKKWKGDN